MLLELDNVLAVVRVLGLHTLLSRFLHILQFTVEAVCDFLEGILNLVDPHFILERLFSPLLNCGDTLINVRLDVGHNFSLKSGLPLAHFIEDLLRTVFNYLSCHCYVFLALFEHLFHLQL